ARVAVWSRPGPARPAAAPSAPARQAGCLGCRSANTAAGPRTSRTVSWTQRGGVDRLAAQDPRQHAGGSGAALLRRGARSGPGTVPRSGTGGIVSTDGRVAGGGPVIAERAGVSLRATGATGASAGVPATRPAARRRAAPPQGPDGRGDRRRPGPQQAGRRRPALSRPQETAQPPGRTGRRRDVSAEPIEAPDREQRLNEVLLAYLEP